METQHGDPNKSDSPHLRENDQLSVRKITTVVVGDIRRADSKPHVLHVCYLAVKGGIFERRTAGEDSTPLSILCCILQKKTF